MEENGSPEGQSLLSTPSRGGVAGSKFAEQTGAHAAGVSGATLSTHSPTDHGSRVAFAEGERLVGLLRETAASSLAFAVIDAAMCAPGDGPRLRAVLQECVRALRPGGLLFVHGQPAHLPAVGVELDRLLTFKYWIAVESRTRRPSTGLPSVHTGILLFTKDGDRFFVRRIRAPHDFCAHCQRPLKDWGGKAHLMHPEGCVLSDVWLHLRTDDSASRLAEPVLHTVLRLVDLAGLASSGPAASARPADGAPLGIVGTLGPAARCAAPAATIAWTSLDAAVPRRRQWLARSQALDDALVDVVHHGDALEILRRYPDSSIDLAFADPPYNLDKGYNVYADQQQRERYVAWCNAWLAEYARLLKPTGSLFVLNLPHWALYHAAFLNQHLCFQSWIVWREMGEPRGKLLPAHYALLHYTKHPMRFTFNYDAVSPIDARCYCLRAACIRARKAAGADDKEPLSDIWWDIHRIRHRRDRDYHPCQLPDALMERIIRLATNPGDVVLDALCGTGTTAVVAARLGRRYVAADIDAEYVRITREKLAAVRRFGFVPRSSAERPRPAVSKKQLQLELRALAARLGRLPTPEDVQRFGSHDVRLYIELFPSWNKALRAAKLVVGEAIA